MITGGTASIMSVQCGRGASGDGRVTTGAQSGAEKPAAYMPLNSRWNSPETSNFQNVPVMINCLV
jgi:hypothetical protein